MFQRHIKLETIYRIQYKLRPTIIEVILAIPSIDYELDCIYVFSFVLELNLFIFTLIYVLQSYDYTHKTYNSNSLVIVHD